MASETLKTFDSKEEKESIPPLSSQEQHHNSASSPVILSVVKDGNADHEAPVDRELAKEEEEEEKISSFLKKLTELWISPFLMQMENIVDSPFINDWEKADAIEDFEDDMEQFEDEVELEGIDLGDVKHFREPELREFTNDFSQDNFFCEARHGRLFKAQISNRRVVVKTLDFYFPMTKFCVYTMSRLHDDIVFLRDPLIKSQPNFVKLIGYCCETKLAFVLDVDPKATVHQLLTSDDFGWEARMKVAVDFGRLLKFSHDNLIIYGSIDAKGILIDQYFDTKFFEFGFHQRVNNKNDKVEFVYKPRPIGYISPEVFIERKWSMKSDVFAYGVLLLNLISKRQEADERWFVKEIETGNKKSLVDDTFEMDEHTGSRITELAMSCVTIDHTSRPEMETVVKNLEDFIGHTI